MEFQLPDFLGECDVDSIHQKMMDLLPPDIDKTEGGFPWDFTRPTALIASELLEFYLPNFLQLIFPQWSTGEFLDLISMMAQVTRREATYAKAELLLTGEPGTIIPTGSVFSTAATIKGEEPIEFYTEAPYYIGEEGTATITVIASEPGKISNVSKGTISIMSEPISGVSTVTNPEKASGGTDEEDDETLRERVLTAFASGEESFIGNDSDFKRWAESVQGMGTAIVLSEWNGPETVKIVCTDANGEVASESILQAIYNKIMSPDEPINRLAPPNTILTVSAPDLVGISYNFTVELVPDFDLETVKESFKTNLENYYKTVSDDREVKYTKVCSILGNTVGVADYKDLTLNGEQKNIPISQEEFPATTSVTAEAASGVND